MGGAYGELAPPEPPAPFWFRPDMVAPEPILTVAEHPDFFDYAVQRIVSALEREEEMRRQQMLQIKYTEESWWERRSEQTEPWDLRTAGSLSSEPTALQECMSVDPVRTDRS